MKRSELYRAPSSHEGDEEDMDFDTLYMNLFGAFQLVGSMPNCSG